MSTVAEDSLKRSICSLNHPPKVELAPTLVSNSSVGSGLHVASPLCLLVSFERFTRWSPNFAKSHFAINSPSVLSCSTTTHLCRNVAKEFIPFWPGPLKSTISNIRPNSSFASSPSLTHLLINFNFFDVFHLLTKRTRIDYTTCAYPYSNSFRFWIHCEYNFDFDFDFVFVAFRIPLFLDRVEAIKSDLAIGCQRALVFIYFWTQIIWLRTTVSLCRTLVKIFVCARCQTNRVYVNVSANFVSPKSKCQLINESRRNSTRRAERRRAPATRENEESPPSVVLQCARGFSFGSSARTSNSS